MATFRVEASECIRCGVSASVAPGIIAVANSGPATVVRQPRSATEIEAVESAMLLCPVAAIHREEAP